MAYDSSLEKYLLSVDGWTQAPVISLSVAVANPVEEWHRTMTQASGWSKEVVSWDLVWCDETLLKEHRIEIRNRFPKPTPDFCA
jgi:hypothetical protein